MAGEFVSLTIDASDLESYLNASPEAVFKASQAAAYRLRTTLPAIVERVFTEAVESTDGAFPAIYANHLLRGLLQYTPTIRVDDFGVYVDVYELETLGTARDLEEGYHYHALLSKQKGEALERLELPFTGQDLLNEDKEQREPFWQSVVDGIPYQIVRKNGSSFYIETAGMYEETLSARVGQWGNRYPEWYLLEYGVEDDYPTFAPTHFQEEIQAEVEQAFADIYEAELEQAEYDVENTPVTISSFQRGGRVFKQLRETGSGRFS